MLQMLKPLDWHWDGVVRQRSLEEKAGGGEVMKGSGGLNKINYHHCHVPGSDK